MTVAFFAERARLDGTITLFLRQARWFVEHGDRVVFISGGGPLEAAFRVAGVVTYELRSVSPLVEASLEQAERDRLVLRDIVREERIEALIATGGRPFTLAADAVSNDCRVVYAILSNDVFAQGEGVVSRVADAAAASAIFALTPLDARVHATKFGINPNVIRVAPLPIDAPKFSAASKREMRRARLGIAKDERLILTAARLDRDHAAYLYPLFESIAALRRVDPRVTLLVVGDGSEAESLRARTNPAIRFLGFRDDLAELHGLADVFIGEGTSMLDAAAGGTPTIATMGQADPARADEAYGLLGIHIIGFVDWRRSSLIPGAPFASALEIGFEPEAAARIAEAGRATLSEFHALDRVMPWYRGFYFGLSTAGMYDVPPPIVDVLRCAANEAELRKAALRLKNRPDIGLQVDADVSWRSFESLEMWEREVLLNAEEMASVRVA